MKKHTEESIVQYLKEYYKNNSKTPKSKDKTHPFCGDTVRKIFGSWNNALSKANIPYNVYNSKTVQCKFCNKSFNKLVSQIKKSNNHFCSRNCSSLFNNKDRIMKEETKQKIREKLQKYKKCAMCDSDITGYKRRTCSEQCHKDSLSKNGKIGGKKGGVISAAKQVRRSQAEIMFANLCTKHFGEDNILCNVPFFKDKNGNLWDADIIIKNIKIAVLYNGIWHYQKVRKNHNLEQVKARDSIKKSIINDNGYSYYIVKDLGKFNPNFVEDQFNLFIHKLNFKKCLDSIILT